MKKDVLISIKGIQTIDGEQDVIELVTTGGYYQKGGKHYIVYEESDATGFKGTKTTVKVEDGCVTMMRGQPCRSQLIIEKGVRHQCHYGTEYGDLMVGVLGDKVIADFTEQTGDVNFKYSLDINTSLTSENEVFIKIKERDN